MRKSNVCQYLILSIALVFSFSACSSDDTKHLPVVPEAKTVEIILSVNTSQYIISLGDEQNFSIQKDLPEWLSYSQQQSKEDGSWFLVFRASENNSDIERLTSFEILTNSKKYEVEVRQAKATQRGIYVLSEGTWKKNQSDIAYYDITNDKLYPKYFSEVNGRNLGDVGNDMAVYGSKMYCLVSEQNPGTNDGMIEVIDPKTCKSIKQIPFTVNQEHTIRDIPRRFIFENGKGYITGFSGVVARLDTLSLTIDAVAKLKGDNLKSEGITQYKNKLYVANSGYGVGNTVSVVDIETMKELYKIDVPTNPVNILAVGDEIYLHTALTSNPSNLYILNPTTEKIEYTFNVGATKLTTLDNYLYTGDMSWTTFEDQISKINLETKEVEPLEFKQKDMYTIYAFNSNSSYKEYYVGSMGDDVIIVDSENNSVKKKIKVKVPYISTIVPIVW